MMTTIALDRYERHVPFFDGSIASVGDRPLKALQIGQANTLRDGTNRHERMLRDIEFDAAEVSLSSYLMAKTRGAAITAIPIFPRRLFSQSQVFVNADGGISSPADLAGKRIGLQSFQTTLAVLAKGDLASEYGIPLETITWVVRNQETIAFESNGDFRIEHADGDTDLGDMLADRAIDGLFFSRFPKTDRPGRIRRLFADPRQEESRYFARNGFFPAMHVVAIAERVIERDPTIAGDLMSTFGEAKAIFETYFDDPNYSQLAWARHAVEEQQCRLGRDLWPIGLAANRANLERFVQYSEAQGLIPEAPPVESLFHESVLES